MYLCYRISDTVRLSRAHEPTFTRRNVWLRPNALVLTVVLIISARVTFHLCLVLRGSPMHRHTGRAFVQHVHACCILKLLKESGKDKALQ